VDFHPTDRQLARTAIGIVLAMHDSGHDRMWRLISRLTKDEVIKLLQLVAGYAARHTDREHTSAHAWAQERLAAGQVDIRSDAA
jgi:hypothetical protein